MINNNNRVKPTTGSLDSRNVTPSVSSVENNIKSSKSSITKGIANDLDSLSTVGLEESSYLKLRPFSELDPTLVRLSRFLSCFGLIVDFEKSKKDEDAIGRGIYRTLNLLIMITIVIISGEVVYDMNLRQSKLLAEQKRSTPLLTFVIVAYSWLSVVMPIFCDISLLIIGSLLFRFYSRTTATVCNGIYFGKRASVDTWYYYLILVFIAFLDAIGQVIVLGVWPPSIDPLMKVVLNGGSSFVSTTVHGNDGGLNPQASATNNRDIYQLSSSTTGSATNLLGQNSTATTLITPRIKAHLLDYLLGPRHAHGDLGVCLKIACLMIQFIHSYSFFIIIISLAHHYATAINDINCNLEKYEFRRLLKQLIILRDSSEQISLMISLPFSCIVIQVFMRQIALYGIIIQSTMLPYENWAVSLQAFTCSVSIIMVFIYCDGLQSASRQTHRLKTEHTVINENKGGNQSIYEFLDYLNRLSKSIRITFFNIITIDKSTLVGLFGHILTLTFVTS